MEQHKWHKEIKAWADGEEIEFKVDGKGEWTLLKGNPYWECKNDLFRIKPQPKEPKYLYVIDGINGIILYSEKQYQENPSQYNIGKIKLEDETNE